MNPDVLEWDTLEYHHIEKSADWFWSLGIIAVSIAILCILFNNILFAIFILLAAAVAGIFAARPPELTHISLQPRGIIAHNILYAYDSLESFWIEEGEHPRILVKSKRFLVPLIVIPISHISPDEVRDYLLQYLPEVEHHESMAHRALEYFGF